MRGARGAQAPGAPAAAAVRATSVRPPSRCCPPAPPLTPRAPPPPPRPPRQLSVAVRADSSGKKRDRGRALDPTSLSTGRALGSGSFGECYAGSLRDPDTGEALPVVLKRVKARVAGAEEMHEAVRGAGRRRGC